MGLLTSKKAANSTPLLIILPILTLSFHKYCKHRFEPAFGKYPLEVKYQSSPGPHHNPKEKFLAFLQKHVFIIGLTAGRNGERQAGEGDRTGVEHES